MIRTQIQLTEEQAARLKRLAAERGVSMAELIREAAEEKLAREGWEARWARARSVFGKFRSGLSDLSERHDEYFAEAIEAKWREPS